MGPVSAIRRREYCPRFPRRRYGFRKDGMRPRLIVLFLLMVCLPLGLLGALGVRVARHEQESTRRRFQEILLKDLSGIDQTIAQLMQKRERYLLAQTELTTLTKQALRDLTRRDPFIVQSFYLTSDGEVAYPSPADELSQTEWSFLDRAKEILSVSNLIGQGETGLSNVILPLSVQTTRNAPVPQQRMVPQSQRDARNQPAPTRQSAAPQPFPAPTRQSAANQGVPQMAQQALPSNQGVPQTTQQMGPPQGQQAGRARAHGWYVWYWGRGIHVLFWRRTPAGGILGAELDGARLMADVVAVLPETLEEGSFPGRVGLCDSLGEVIYQWGGYDPPEGAIPLAEKALRYPLSAWGLKYYLPPGYLNTKGGALYFNLLVGLGAAGLAFIGLAVYFYRESSREMRDAAQRVTFVNQVSHELKTPLTNIRMYAELLERTLPEEEEKTRGHLGIIVSESQRLSRLIGNILTFSRKQRHKLNLHMSPGAVDEVVRTVLDHFRASLEDQGIRVGFEAGAAQTVQLDPDALAQILGNLFCNVEKYAASGGGMRVVTRQEPGWSVITVSDNGPGIPPGQREKIFLPFHRISDKLNDGVTGTGIGLTISRDLARLHGGDLVVLASERGAVFELRIATPREGGAT